MNNQTSYERLNELHSKVMEATDTDNSLDVEIEVALFVPDKRYASVRPNAAGTKVIYTTHDGEQKTCIAWDWTMGPANRNEAIEGLTALIVQAQP